MKNLIPFIPIYAVLVPVAIYLVNHEKKHLKIYIYLKLICHRLGIPCDEKDQ